MELGSLKYVQPTSVYLSWDQYLLLDVAAVIFVALWIPWLTVLLLLAVLDVGTAQKVLSPKPETGPKRILVFLPIPSRSHHNVFDALINGLLERGHYVTKVTPIPGKVKHPRKREIITVDPIKVTFRDYKPNFFEKQMNAVEKLMMMYFAGPLFQEMIMSEPKVMELKSEKFDLVITEAFFFQEAMVVYAHHFGCPSIALAPSGYSLIMNDITGGSVNPSYVANYFSTVDVVNTLQDRLWNTLTSIFTTVSYHLYYYPTINALMHKHFPDAPPLYDLLNNISVSLINNNDALMYPVPLAPSVIQVGGIHIKPGKPLTEDLKKWIEESKEGIVYFSLGSNLKADMLPEEKKDAILSSLRKLKQRVLLKWDGPIPENPPANCRFEEWVPQQEVLAHPKLRVFVTHGGLLSTQESVFYGAPIVALPVFGDQQMNAVIAVEKGFAVALSFFDLSTDAFDAALNEVINNPKYRERSQKLKEYFRSDPVPPLEKAVYYTELVMKLGTLKHLQPASVHLSWYQYLLLDVAAVILVALWISWRVIRCVFGKLIGICRKPKAAAKAGPKSKKE